LGSVVCSSDFVFFFFFYSNVNIFSLNWTS